MIKTYIKNKTPYDFGIGVFDNFKKILIDLAFVSLTINFKTKHNPFIIVIFAIGIPYWKSFWVFIADKEWFRREQYRKNAIEYGLFT